MKKDWVLVGLSELARNGPSALKAEPLAKLLNVSRGSFYWHFKDVAAFEAAVIEAWKEQSTQGVIRFLEARLSLGERLSRLIEMALSDDLRLDRAVRSWSLTDRRVQRAVEQIDRQRINYIESLLRDLGAQPKDIRARARILYWSSLGRLMTTKREENRLSSAEVKRLARLMAQ